MNEKNNSDWYRCESWYAPNGPEPKAEPPQKKRRGLTKARLWGMLLLLVLLIAASSLAFSQEPAPLPETEGGKKGESKLPDSAAEFFENYYNSVTGIQPESELPRAELPLDFSLQLQPAPAGELELTELYQNCSPSIVAIMGYAGDEGRSWGTGIVLSEDGLILTNAHVIDGCDRVEVSCSDEALYEAKLVGMDSISDLAVLQIGARGLKPAAFGESKELQVGQKVAAIGNPLGEDFRLTLTDGIISAIERGVSYNGHSMSLLQTNTAINEGNSGGALFNMQGQVIGITNMKMMSSYSSIEGIGFAIPSSLVQTVVDSLVEHGEYRGRPALGITVGAIPPAASVAYQLPEGLYVSGVAEGSDAKAQGVRVGDVLLEFNGFPVTSTDEVNTLKDQMQVGDSVNLLLWRDGKEVLIAVKLVDSNDIY